MDDFVINRADEYGRSIYLRDRPASTRSVIFTGAPGSGKSFMLRHAADQARAAGDLVIRIDASSREPLQSRMTRAIGDQLDQLKHETPVGANRLLNRLHRTLDTMLSNRFDIQNAISGSLSWWPPLRIAFTHGRDQQFERPTSSVNDLADRLGDLAADRGRQVMVLIDNLDRAHESDLAAINELAAHLDDGKRPVHLTMAASQPALDKLLVAAMPEGLASDAARSYDVRSCGPVPAAELRPALTARIARNGAAVLPDAADSLVAEANGDPGRLLRLADQATELATGPHGVTAETADAAITRLRHDDAWIYNAGWNNLSGRAKAILAEAAADPRGSSVAELNKGLDPDEWAERDAARNELIGAGFVRESDGRLMVADPGLQEWITDHTGSRPTLSSVADTERDEPDIETSKQTAGGTSVDQATRENATKDLGKSSKDTSAKDESSAEKASTKKSSRPVVTKDSTEQTPKKQDPAQDNSKEKPAAKDTTKKGAAKKAEAKQVEADKITAKKAATTETASTKSAGTKSPAKKSPAKDPAAEHAAAKKSAPTKSAAKKTATKKSTPAKKAAASKSTTSKSTVTASNTKPSRAKPSNNRPSKTKPSKAKPGNTKTSATKKAASTSPAKTAAAKKSPAAKSARPTTDLHAVQPSAARPLSARPLSARPLTDRPLSNRQARLRPAPEPAGRAS